MKPDALLPADATRCRVGLAAPQPLRHTLLHRLPDAQARRDERRAFPALPDRAAMR